MPETQTRPRAATAAMAAVCFLAAGCVTSGASDEPPPATTLAVPEDAPASEEEVGLGDDTDDAASDVTSCADLTNFIFSMANKLEQAFNRHFGDEALRSAIQSSEELLDPAAEPPVEQNAPSPEEFASTVESVRGWITGPTADDRFAMLEACYLAGIHEGAKEQWDAGQQEQACRVWKEAGTRSNTEAPAMQPAYPVAARLLASALANIAEGNGRCETWQPGAGAAPSRVPAATTEAGEAEPDASGDEEGG